MAMITYKNIERPEVTAALFDGFDRYQEVKKCWRKIGGAWILKDIAFIEQWNEQEYAYLAQCLRRTLETGGAVVGAFTDGGLVGFASVEGRVFGGEQMYVQLSSLHVSYGRRGEGIGKALFARACSHARKLGAKKLYISSHSAEETQAFYKSVGCVEAAEYDAALTAAEPCDCQLEYLL